MTVYSYFRRPSMPQTPIWSLSPYQMSTSNDIDTIERNGTYGIPVFCKCFPSYSLVIFVTQAKLCVFTFTKYKKKRGLTLIKFNLFIKRGNQNEKKNNLGCPSTTSFQENKKVENEVHNDLLIAIESLNKIH
jgi:hypothetical protein